MTWYQSTFELIDLRLFSRDVLQMQPPYLATVSFSNLSIITAVIFLICGLMIKNISNLSSCIRQKSYVQTRIRSDMKEIEIRLWWTHLDNTTYQSSLIIVINLLYLDEFTVRCYSLS